MCLEDPDWQLSSPWSLLELLWPGRTAVALDLAIAGATANIMRLHYNLT